MRTRLPVLALSLALACGYRPAREGHAAASQPPVTFPHSTHVDADVPCSACHDLSAATRLAPGERHVRIPPNVTKQKPCSDCHDTEPKLKVAPARDAAYRITFSHADHLKRVQDCKACHARLPEPGDKEMPPPPPMAACTACHHHQQEFAQARCTPCHVDLKGYKPESAFRHEGSWLATHGALARSSGESCAACHDQTFCTSCHSPATAAAKLENVFPERVERAFIHRGDYVSRHMIDAQAQPASCRACHGTPFCSACHSANGLTPDSLLGTRIMPASHTTAFLSGGHKNDARRDISACAACHDQHGAANSCKKCHASGGRNPHPPGFLSKFKTSDIAKNSMCRECHP